MAEQILIAKADIAAYYDIGINVNDSRVDPHILRAQQNDLVPVLGEELYFVFVEDYDGSVFVDQKYTDLFNGKTYKSPGQNKDIYFRGVKPLLCSYAYARLIANNQTFVVRGGVVEKTTEQSEVKPENEVLQKQRNAYSDAIKLRVEVDRFLDQHRTDYPEYDGPYSASVNKTSFGFTRVPTVVRPKQY